MGKLRSFLYAGGLCSLVGLAVLGVEIEPASASTNPLEQEPPEALMSSALEEPDPQPSSTAAVLSTCDPDDYYSQFCCDLLDAANQAQSPDDMEMAWLRCDPSLTVTNPGQGGDDCIDASCSGPTSCKYLKKGCNFISGNFTCSGTNGSGQCTNGKCEKCW